MQALNRLYMDIKQIGTNNTPAAEARRADRAPETKVESGSANSSEAIARQPVEFAPSTEAQRLSEAIDKAKAQPEVDTARVERLRAAIAEGSYTVDANRLADNLIRFERQTKG